jgi:NADH dehydrogenase
MSSENGDARAAAAFEQRTSSNRVSKARTATEESWPHVVIVGGGFGGLTAAKALRRAKVRVTVVDRTNHHLFQPLLYQVATAGLSSAEIAAPIRDILSAQKNTRVLLAEVKRIDLARRTVVLEEGELAYDFLVVAAGAKTNYFGNDAWEVHAPGLKTLEDAHEIRRRVLLAFERAERETDPARRAALLTFVVIGGGPTGVELAGALSELSRHVLRDEFRAIDPRGTKIVLVEAGPLVLPTFDTPLPSKALEQLHELEVEVITGKPVTQIDESGVTLGDERIPSATVIWGAGVRAHPLASTLGVPLDRAGRIIVEQDCSLPSHPEAFAIGDIAAFEGEDGQTLPGVSPVAMQQARAVAANIRRTLEGQPRSHFRYRDKGTMATIGRSRAVAQAGRVKLSGFIAWLAWLFVHVFYLIGFRNRIVVMFNWAWSYITFNRGARIILRAPGREREPLTRVSKSPAAPAPPRAQPSDAPSSARVS